MDNLEAQSAVTQVSQNTQSAQSQLDQAALDRKLVNLQGLDLGNAVVNIYVAKISTTNKEKRFVDVKRLKVENDDKQSFKQYVTDCVAGNEHICELRTINTSQDNRFFHVEKAATDFAKLEEVVTTGSIPFVLEKSELNAYNAYVIQLTFGDPEESVFAFRYISGSWSVNKTSGKFLRFSPIDNELIVSIDSDPRFQITPYIDFIQYKNDMFIADIRQFEVAMNYHERLKEKKAEAITALCDSNAMATTSSDALKSIIGNDKYLMRQLASVHEKSLYNNDIWLAKLRNAAEAAGNWKIKFDDSGQILVEEDKEYVKELLILLQNKRVKTVVDEVIFDVDGELVALEATE